MFKLPPNCLSQGNQYDASPQTNPTSNEADAEERLPARVTAREPREDLAEPPDEPDSLNTYNSPPREPIHHDWSYSPQMSEPALPSESGDHDEPMGIDLDALPDPWKSTPGSPLAAEPETSKS